MPVEHRKPFSCHLLIALHLFLGIGALLGGGALIISPSGMMLHMPLTVLQHSPFHNFLIPGIILFAALGIFPLVTSIFLILEKTFKTVEKLKIYKSTHWSWNCSLYIGYILIIWITIEIYIIQSIVLVHVFYIFLGLFIQFVTLLPSVKMHYSNK